MNPKSVVWFLWIILLNSLCCCGRSEQNKFMTDPKIHSKTLRGPRSRSQFNQKYISSQQISDYSTFNNIKINKLEKQLLKNTTKEVTYPINKHIRNGIRFKRGIFKNKLSDSIIFSSPYKQFNVSRVRRAARNTALVETENSLYRGTNSSQSNHDAIARNSLYIHSDLKDTEVNQEKNRQEKTNQGPAVSNRHIWIKEKDHTAPSPTSFNESETANDNETFNALVEQFKRMYPISLWKENGWFKEDYLYIINAHWLQFPPPSKASHYTLAVVYIFVLTAGISGNALVIFMFFK